MGCSARKHMAAEGRLTASQRQAYQVCGRSQGSRMRRLAEKCPMQAHLLEECNVNGRPKLQIWRRLGDTEIVQPCSLDDDLRSPRMDMSEQASSS